MPFGRASLKRLSTCDPRLVAFARELERGVDRGDLAPYVLDIAIPFIGGWRGEAEQNDAFERRASKVRWPHSKHNARPLSLAIDIVPFPIEWADDRQELILRGYGLGVAARMGLRLRTIAWDLPHWELVDADGPGT